MRQDYWLFLGYLLGMGIINEPEEFSHDSVEVAASFNGPMKVSVGGESFECSLLALGPGVDHTIDGSRGWQFFGYLHPESRLAQLISRTIGESGKTWLCGTSGFDRMDSLGLGLDSEFSPYRIRELWEFLLSHLLGIKSYSLGWSVELNRIFKQVESMARENLNIRALAGCFNMSDGELEKSFFHLSGIPLTHFLFTVKLARAANMIKKGTGLDQALAAAGLSGRASVTGYISRLYGLDMENLLTEKPYIRFFSATDYEQLSGHAL